MQLVITVSALTALIATILAHLLGMVWYSKFFGKKYMEVIGADVSASRALGEKQNMLITYGLSVITSFVMFFALTFFTVFIGPLNLVGTLTYGFFMWLGFSMPMNVGAVLWSGKQKKLLFPMFLINAGYNLVTFLLTVVVWHFLLPYFLS